MTKMIHAKHARFTALSVAAVAAAAVLAAVAGPARAQDPMTPPTTMPTTGPAAAGMMVDNPQYAMWSKFKAGSSSTLEGDVDSPMGKAHLTVTQTLKAVTPEAVTLDVAMKATIMGQSQDLPVNTQTIPAKEAKEDSKETGKEDVDAMGKTFHCTVHEQSTMGKGRPFPGGGTAKFYISDEVPGGLVKTVVPAKAGQTSTMTLKAMDAK